MKTHKIRSLTAPITILGALLGALTGCSVTGPLREDPKADGFQLGSLPSEWVKQDLEAGADAVFFDKKTKSLISVNSTCDRYTDSQLETLSQDLLSPIKSAKVLSQEDLQISDRRALLTSVEGKLDGVPVTSHLVVMRKNRCLFDFSLYGTSIAPEQRAQFLNFVKGFRYQETK